MSGEEYAANHIDVIKPLAHNHRIVFIANRQMLEQVINLPQKSGDIEAGNINNRILGALEQFRLIMQGDFLAVEQYIFGTAVIQ